METPRASIGMKASPRQSRSLAAAGAATLFAVIWAILQWPWVRHADDARGSQAGAWLFIAYFVALSVLLLSLPRVGRWLGLATGALLLIFISLVLPAVVGITQFSCRGAGWRCYVEGLAVFGTGAALVASCFRPFNRGRASNAA
jgi:hypothetical protein